MISDHQDFYNGRRVLIIGGLGFIGSNLAMAMVKLNAKVTLMDSMISAKGESFENVTSIQDRVAIHVSDIRDVKRLRNLIHNQEVIFNLAGQVSHIESMRDPINDLDINCRCQLTLLECCREANLNARIVYPSTRQVYGRARYLPVDEQHPVEPPDVNAINKLAAEMYSLLYARVYAMQCVCLRLTNTYGPRMDLQNPSLGFVGVFLKQAMVGEKIRVFGSGKQRRDFNHVSDVVEALLLAGYHRDVVGQSFNLGGGQPYSIIEFLDVLRGLIGFEYELTPFPEERGSIEIGDYVGDYSRFRKATGWSPQLALREGLADTLEYSLAHPRLVSPASPSGTYHPASTLRA